MKRKPIEKLEELKQEWDFVYKVWVNPDPNDIEIVDKINEIIDRQSELEDRLSSLEAKDR